MYTSLQLTLAAELAKSDAFKLQLGDFTNPKAVWHPELMLHDAGERSVFVVPSGIRAERTSRGVYELYVNLNIVLAAVGTSETVAEEVAAIAENITTWLQVVPEGGMYGPGVFVFGDFWIPTEASVDYEVREAEDRLMTIAVIETTWATDGRYQ